MEVVASYAMHSDNQYEEEISIVLNQNCYNQSAITEEIMKKFVQNDLLGVMFSFDVNGYPHQIKVDVCETMNKYNEAKVEFSFVGILVDDEKYEYEINTP